VLYSCTTQKAYYLCSAAYTQLKKVLSSAFGTCLDIVIMITHGRILKSTSFCPFISLINIKGGHGMLLELV
jgi:hypothetical protein